MFYFGLAEDKHMFPATGNKFEMMKHLAYFMKWLESLGDIRAKEFKRVIDLYLRSKIMHDIMYDYSVIDKTMNSNKEDK